MLHISLYQETQGLDELCVSGCAFSFFIPYFFRGGGSAAKNLGRLIANPITLNRSATLTEQGVRTGPTASIIHTAGEVLMWLTVPTTVRARIAQKETWIAWNFHEGYLCDPPPERRPYLWARGCRFCKRQILRGSIFIDPCVSY